MKVSDDESKSNPHSRSFDAFLFLNRDETQTPEEQVPAYQSAITGLVGMLRFGNHDSPVLLEALGDLLSSQLPLDDRPGANANRLGARAYLVAASVSEEPMRLRLRQRTEHAISIQVGEELEETETELRQELEQANDLAARITADEKRWAEQGLDLDTMFSDNYGEIAPLRVSTTSEWRSRLRILGLITLVIALTLTISKIRRLFKRQKNLLRNPNSLTGMQGP